MPDEEMPNDIPQDSVPSSRKTTEQLDKEYHDALQAYAKESDDIKAFVRKHFKALKA